MIRLRSMAAAHPGAMRKGLRWVGLFLALWSVAGTRPASAEDFMIEGRIKAEHGWSGYWWPQLATRGFHLYDEQGSFTPLLKYAQLMDDSGPLQWERRNKYTTDPNNTWWGHCNGWAASSVLEPEPKKPMKLKPRVQGQPIVEMNVGEIKGLLAAAHNGDPADFISGARHDQGADYRTDLRAGAFHAAVLYYMWQREEGIVFNITPKPEVWNFPAYAFHIEGETVQGESAGGNEPIWNIRATIWYADDNVRPDYQGTSGQAKTYTYQIRGKWASPTAAEWTGNSVTDHPQFVWHPAYAQAYIEGVEEPNTLDVKIVQRIAQLSADVPAATTAPSQ
jgi:Transglutaminase elicitor